MEKNRKESSGNFFAFEDWMVGNMAMKKKILVSF